MSKVIELGNGKKVELTGPKENIERGGEHFMAHHTLNLFLDGEIIGGVEMTYLSVPMPHYQVDNLHVKYSHQGRGYGSQIMDQVESFLKKKGRAGVLVDAISEDHPALGMYERRGWQRVEDTGLFVYNLPQSASLKDFVGYSCRKVWLSEREVWKEIMEKVLGDDDY